MSRATNNIMIFKKIVALTLTCENNNSLVWARVPEHWVFDTRRSTEKPQIWLRQQKNMANEVKWTLIAFTRNLSVWEILASFKFARWVTNSLAALSCPGRMQTITSTLPTASSISFLFSSQLETWSHKNALHILIQWDVKPCDSPLRSRYNTRTWVGSVFAGSPLLLLLFFSSGKKWSAREHCLLNCVTSGTI